MDSHPLNLQPYLMFSFLKNNGLNVIIFSTSKNLTIKSLKITD